jgi:hypothetical protein
MSQSSHSPANKDRNRMFTYRVQPESISLLGGIRSRVPPPPPPPTWTRGAHMETLRNSST